MAAASSVEVHSRSKAKKVIAIAITFFEDVAELHGMFKD